MVRKVFILDGDGLQDAGSLLTELKTALSADEYRQIRTRLMGGKARVGAEGYRPSGGRYMYGYRAVRVGGRSGGMNQEPDPVTSPRLISILKAYVEGGSAHAARWAMAKKIPAPYGGENWNASQVFMLVKRVDAYATGENTVTVEGQPFTYKFKPIVPKDLYRAVVTRQKEHKVTPRAVMMTTGYATCAHCGDNVVAQKAASQPYYYLTCKTASRNGTGACLRIREDIVGPQIWDGVIQRLVAILEAEAPKPGKDTFGPRLKEAEAKALKNKEAMERLLELYEGGDIEKALLHTRMAKLKIVGNDIAHEIETLRRARKAHEAKSLDEHGANRRRRRRQKNRQDVLHGDSTHHLGLPVVVIDRRAKRRARRAREALQAVAPETAPPVDWSRIAARYSSLRGRAVTHRYVLLGPPLDQRTPYPQEGRVRRSLQRLSSQALRA